MTRKQQIHQAASKRFICNLQKRAAFVSGAAWADKNPKSPWISVEEELPERHTPVYAKNNNKSWFFALRTDNRQRPWYNIVGRCGEKVTHWMPIPELK